MGVFPNARPRIVIGTTMRLMIRAAIAIVTALALPNRSPRIAGPMNGTAGADAVSAASTLSLNEKREWHGIQQHHAIEDRRFLRPKVVAPSSHETEQQREDDRSQCAQNGLYHSGETQFVTRGQSYRIARTISAMRSMSGRLLNKVAPERRYRN